MLKSLREIEMHKERLGGNILITYSLIQQINLIPKSYQTVNKKDNSRPTLYIKINQNNKKMVTQALSRRKKEL